MLNRALCLYIISFLAFISPPTKSFAAAPLILLIPKGLSMLGAALGLGAKAIVLSAASLKLAAIGTGFIVKGLMFTKTGAVVMTVAAGGIHYSQTADATISTLGEIGYTTDNPSTLPLVRNEIGHKAKEKGIYITKYCLLPTGEKVVIPSEYKICPVDGSMPKQGHEFIFTNDVTNN
jgi:hypothetical protein